MFIDLILSTEYTYYAQPEQLKYKNKENYIDIIWYKQVEESIFENNHFILKYSSL